MEITLTTPFQIAWEDSISHEISQKTITKIEVSNVHINYRNNSLVLSVAYKDDADFRASTNHSAFGSKAVDPVIGGANFTTLDATGINQSEIYSFLQSQNTFLAGAVA